MKEELRPRLNHKPVSDPTCKLRMGDPNELTPAIPDKSLTEDREEIQHMYHNSDMVAGMTASAPRLMLQSDLGRVISTPRKTKSVVLFLFFIFIYLCLNEICLCYK